MFRCVLSELFTDDDPGDSIEFYLDMEFGEAWKQLGEMLLDSSYTRGTMFASGSDQCVYDCFDNNGCVSGAFGPLDFPESVS